MSGFLSHDIWRKMIIAARRSTKPCKIASAYISLSGIRSFPLAPGSKVVVDASNNCIINGSTEVDALRYLIDNNVEVYHFNNLHAKVFLFDAEAFVGSTNISSNSRYNLNEASYMTDKKDDLNAIDSYLNSLCINRLDNNRVENLGKLPVVSRRFKNIALAYRDDRLIMQLTGESRGTQVQPPVPIWNHYFGIDLGWEDYPVLNMKNVNLDPEYYPRNVVRHDHTLTFEVPELTAERPAIMSITREGNHFYKYEIISSGGKKFEEFDSILQTMDNPLRSRGRRWVMF